jgi:hypothetical protein
MNSQKRRAIAYIAGRLNSGKTSGAIYDYAASSHYRIYGDVSPDFIQVFDDDRYSYIIGGATPAGLSIFDYYTRQHINLRISGDDFYGYDLETSSYFSGMVNKNTITLFDFQCSKDFRYAIQ